MDLSTLMPEQRRVVTTLDRPLFVSAGAGSGKTFTLTRRILWALSPESGPYLDDIGQVLAITFTRKAAAELKERVRRALMEEGMVDAALAVDSAWISTIHGMCARILRTYSLELGIDPAFEVLDYADELKEEALDRVMASLGDARSSYPNLRRAYRLVAGAGPVSRGSDVSSMAGKLLGAAVSCAGGFDAVSWVRASADVSDLADAYRMLLSADGLSASARAVCEAALAAIEAFEASDRGQDAVAALIEGCAKPRSSKAIADVMPYFKAQRADALLSAYFAQNEPARAELDDLSRRLFDEYGALKRERGGLDNDDLLRLAYDALVRNPDVRAEFQGRFKMVMVDEFQDTSAQQVELIERLCSPDRRELCTVGDAQQSIYRFRGADVSVFRRQERAVASGEGGELVKLARNFRSHADILEYVRRVFGGEGGLMRGFLDLEPSPTREDGLRAMGVSRRQAVLVAGGTSAERAQAKARALAQRLRAYRDAGQPVEDMVILLGSMSAAGTYADAVRREGMACVVSGGSVFSSAVEVRAVAALLRFLADPADTREGLLPVLTSPMFALGADELLALATALDDDGSVRRANLDVAVLSAADDDLSALPLARAAVRTLAAAAREVGRRPAARIARDVVSASGWLDRLERQGAEGLAVAANVLKALSLAERLGSEAPCAARRLSIAFERHLAQSKEAPGALTGEGEGAVRIMTVHASKGLEFPVVAVADCYAARVDADKLALSSDGGSVRACLAPDTFDAALKKRADGLKRDWRKALSEGADLGGSGSAWSAYDEMVAENLAADLEERSRLLYVAMTRAREALVLVLDAGTAPGGSRKLALDPDRCLTGRVLERVLPEGAALDADRLSFDDSVPGDYELVALADFEHDGVAYAASGPCDGQEAGPAEPEAAAPFLLVDEAGRAPAPAACPEPPHDSYSYSSLARELSAEREDRAVPSGCDGDDPEGAGCEDGPAVALGSAFHAAAQIMVQTGERPGPARLDALCRYWGATDAQRARLERALDRWERSEVRRDVLSWPCLRAEVPFFAPGMDGLAAFAEGAIDLLATDPARPGAALVVDYKTGGSPDEGADELAGKHELQARVYADALHKAGFSDVTLRFVRVEQDDPARPGEPQVVEYRL